MAIHHVLGWWIKTGLFSFYDLGNDMGIEVITDIVVQNKLSVRVNF